MCDAQDDLSTVRANVFPGGFNCGLCFANHGLAVAVQETPNSVAQMTGFSEGRCEGVMTAVDNIVAYVEGQGEAPIGAQPDFFAFMGSDNGFLSLVTAPGARRVRPRGQDDLRGRADHRLCVRAL
jgi:hypothetical protein